MSDFGEVIQEFKRMCWFYQRECKCPMECPMRGVNISQCRKLAFEEPEITEQTVMAWANEHPETKYPSLWEWLVSIGAVANVVPPDVAFTLKLHGILEPIDEKTAKIFGIKSKEE